MSSPDERLSVYKILLSETANQLEAFRDYKAFRYLDCSSDLPGLTRPSP